MFTCRDSIDLLRQYMDGELSPEEALHLKRHFEGCPPCVEYLESYRATPEVCRQVLSTTMPPELSTRLTQFLRAKCGKKQP